MPTLAQTLAMTTPVSALLRKGRRLGIRGVDAMIALAAARGCGHYATETPPRNPPHRTELSDDELTILLIIGENSYHPTAIRCAAQLARSPHVRVDKLARLARMEKCERVLGHIARAGAEHDSEGASFWRDLLTRISAPAPRPETHLPHWSRFVSMPGRQRHGIAPHRWLVPNP